MSKGQEELKPCPFCGGAAKRVTLDDDANFDGDVIVCTKCDACSRVVFGEKEGLVDAWNRRQQAPAEQEPVYEKPYDYSEGYPGHYDPRDPSDLRKMVCHLESLLDAIPDGPLYTAPIAAEPAPEQDERECCCPKIGEPWNPEKHGRDCPVHQVARPAQAAPPQLIEANRAAFESRFGLDIWPVYEWLRNRGVIQQAAPQPEQSDNSKALAAALERVARLEAALRTEAIMSDRAYRNGLQQGYSLGCVGDEERYQKAMTAYGDALAKHGEASHE